MSRKRALHQCEDCAASFDRPFRLANHRRRHTGERPFVCEYEDCGKSYSNSSHLKRHEITHKSFHNCPVEGCSEILKTKDTLKKHIDNIHQKKNRKLYKCTECDKEFNKRNWLQSHICKHHNGRCPYKCTIEDCGKEFLMPSKLKSHMKTHSGYKCKIEGCEEVFLKWSVYVTHLKQFHSKVHKCDICEREFSTSSNLKSHREIHEQKRMVFACDMPNCSRFYFAEKNLKWHVKSFHEARPFICDMEFCHRAFKTKDALEYHKLCHSKRRRQKKKKPIPSTAAVLSGCADPRKFTRKMPPKQITSESSEEFTTDEEVMCNQDTSKEENSHENYDLGLIGSVYENKTNPLQLSYNNLPHKRARLESSSIYLSVVEEEVCMDVETSQKDNFPKTFDILEGDKELTHTDDIESSLRETSNWGLPRKHAKLATGENDFTSNEKNDLVLNVTSSEKHEAVVSNHATSNNNNSGCMLKQKACLEDSASSSEYETITVTILNSVCNKNCSESDEMSSCLSDAGG